MISLLETKIMNFMSVFFKKKNIQDNSSVVNNMQYNSQVLVDRTQHPAFFIFFFNSMA